MQNKQPYAHQKVARQQNMSLLLRDLWRNGPLSKAMLAQRNDLTKATVSTICRDLAALGLIKDAGQDRTGLGRPSDLIELNCLARCSIGIEISTNYVSGALSDLCGNLLWTFSTPVQIGSSPEIFICTIEDLISTAVNQAETFNIPLLGIGVGLPGVVNHTVHAPAIGWKDVPLKEILANRFHLPVVIDNKARCAAVAEALHGSAKEANSFVYISIGTDVQSTVEAAVVHGGFLYRGSQGRAVDAGHIVLDPNGPFCKCGQRGCWSVMTDVDREVEMVRQRIQAGEASVLERHAANNFANLEHRAIHQAAVEGDALASKVASEVILYHALGIANLILMFDPELVVIGWETMVLPHDYTARMRLMDQMPEFNISSAVQNRLSRRGIQLPKIVHATLDPDVVMLGAAAILVSDFLHLPPTDS